MMETDKSKYHAIAVRTVPKIWFNLVGAFSRNRNRTPERYVNVWRMSYSLHVKDTLQQLIVIARWSTARVTLNSNSINQQSVNQFYTLADCRPCTDNKNHNLIIISLYQTHSWMKIIWLHNILIFYLFHIA